MTPQSYQDWRRSRAGHITASQFKRVMDAKTTRAWRTLLADIRSDAAAIEQGIFVEQQAPALEWGHAMEPRALAHYTLETGNLYEAAPFIRYPGGLPIGASCDGLIGDDGIVEIKCPYSMDGFDRYRRDGVSSVHWQALGQLWVTGRRWCDVCIYDPRRADYDQLHIVRLERGAFEEEIARMAKLVIRFAGYLVRGDEPGAGKIDAELSYAA